MIIQVCFQVKDTEHNQMIIEKLKEVKAKLNDGDKIISCHLPKAIVEEKQWDTTICDALVDIFGSQYECMVKTEDFNYAMHNMHLTRASAALSADRIIIIGEQSIRNIALEIELFTSNKVQFI